MGCSSCSSGGTKSKGCGNNGSCSTGGCNRLNTYDWLTALEVTDVKPYPMAEVSFKNGSSKDFFRIDSTRDHIDPGDMVMVESDSGWNVGRVNMIGELVKVQMKKKRVSEKKEFKSIIRLAGDTEIKRLETARKREKETMIKARVIARTLGLDMKISDVEFQADERKAVFYFIANGRVDFRELIKEYAREFRIKIEMKQIGSRQESALVGGIGSCGRELCCSTWLSNFKSVNTSAARYQNLAINQAKLSGQCGRLKCCLNYELDMYMEALEEYPQHVNKLKTKASTAYFVKTDIFKKAMYYSYKDDLGRQLMIALSPDRVEKIAELNKKGEFPDEFGGMVNIGQSSSTPEEEIDFEEDLTGIIELPPEKRNRRSNRSRRGRRPDNQNRKPRGEKPEQNKKPNQASNEKRPQQARKNRRNKPRPKPDSAKGNQGSKTT